MTTMETNTTSAKTIEAAPAAFTRGYFTMILCYNMENENQLDLEIGQNTAKYHYCQDGSSKTIHLTVYRWEYLSCIVILYVDMVTTWCFRAFLEHKNKGWIARALVPMHKIQSPPLLQPKLQKKHKPACYKVTHFPEQLFKRCAWAVLDDWALFVFVQTITKWRRICPPWWASSRRSLWSSQNSHAARLRWMTQLLCTSVICTELLLIWLKAAYGASSVWCVDYAKYSKNCIMKYCIWHFRYYSWLLDRKQ